MDSNSLKVPSLTEVIRSNPRASGFAIIISNDYATTPGLDTLKGTHKDSEKMEGAFKSLNIITYKASNNTKFQLGALLNEVAQCKEYPRESRCIAFVFSGHGLDSNHVYMQDGKLMHIANEIIQPLLPMSAPHISKIPKLFFIDACRGSRYITPVVVSRGTVQEMHQKGGTDATVKVPPEGNFLVAFSTMPEYRSYEMKGEGGVWMTALAEKLRTSQDHVEGILTDVRKELLEKYQSPGWTARMQQPETLSRLNEKVCLARDIIKPVGRQAELTNGTTTGPSFLTHRDPPATQKSPQHPGHFRGLLNQLFQCDEITKPDYTETNTVDEGNVARFIGVVDVTFTRQGIRKRACSPQTKEDTSEEPNQDGAQNSSGNTGTASQEICYKRAVSAPAQLEVVHPKLARYTNPVEKLYHYCIEKGKPEPKYYEPQETPDGRFVITVYVAQTCGRTKGDARPTVHEAKEDAAEKVLRKLHIY